MFSWNPLWSTSLRLTEMPESLVNAAAIARRRTAAGMSPASFMPKLTEEAPPPLPLPESSPQAASSPGRPTSAPPRAAVRTNERRLTFMVPTTDGGRGIGPDAAETTERGHGRLLNSNRFKHLDRGCL